MQTNLCELNHNGQCTTWPSEHIEQDNRYLWLINGSTLTQDDARRAPSLPRRRCLVFVRVVAVKMWMWVAVRVTRVRGGGFARWRLLLLRLLLLLLLLLRTKMRTRPVLGVPAMGHLIEAQWFLHLRHRQRTTLLLRDK